MSFWWDVVAHVVRLWCAEPLKEVWTVQDCGFRFFCAAGSVTHYVVRQKTGLGA